MTTLDERATAARTVPLSAADRPWAHAGTVACVLGPLRPTDPGAVVDAVRRLTAAGPQTRVGLVRSGLREWSYDPSAPGADDLVTSVGDLPEAEFRELVARRVASAHPTGDPARPVHLVVADRWFSIIDSHLFGDGSQVMRVAAAILAIAHGSDLPAWTAEQPFAKPVRTALRRTFRRPAQIRALLADRPDLVTMTPTGATPWQPSPRLVHARTTTAARKALVAWGAQHAPGATLSALGLAAVRTALVAEGIDLDPVSSVAINARRYLPRGAHVPGNFAARLVVAPDAPNSPAALSESIERACAVGRPLAALAASALGSWRMPAPPAVPDTAPDGVPAHLGYSWFGRPMEIERVPWDVPTDERTITGQVDPGGPNQFGALAFLIGGGLQVSLNFHDNRHDAAAVRRAVEAVAADPIAVLAR